ncbi:hypothetical protein DH2020_015844 [Rehmannia glutinosa]|uniref:RRM domain-containing protein n=1 Tax=Rehmannia glutinosa TaxID=99300 RepID=A0ABR0WX29_REHGL
MGDYGDAMMRNQNAAVQARTKAQNRANVMQLKLIGQSHPTGLTTNLLKLFEPRPPLEYKPPPEKRKCPSYTGMAQFVSNFAEPGNPEYAPPVQKGETPVTLCWCTVNENYCSLFAQHASTYTDDPNNDPNISGDPYKTLFVARLNYETTESRIKREFEAYGPIKRVRLITDKESNKPRGYAFIEFVHTRDMKAAYKQADGKKIDNRRVIVDVERGRTVPNWRPRRLGGGLGTSRVGSEEANQKHLGRKDLICCKIDFLALIIMEDTSFDALVTYVDRNLLNCNLVNLCLKLQVDGLLLEPVQSGAISISEEPRVERDREKERERDYEIGDDHDRGRSHDTEYDYERGDLKHGRGERERNYGSAEAGDHRGWSDQPEHGHGHPETEHEDGHYDYYGKGRGQYDIPDGQGGDYDRYRESDRDNDRYDQMEDDGYGYDRDASEPKDKDYRRSDRSLSREH